ncbi:hypothetical protein A3I46_00465 [Candidatus Kaiserbacteria bacterium RIFCSPLOWO2_02_FULL_54_13]|uniref:Uncharacterized protein n=1 Tax=Candidatus Kaiserbacteria bacterium RIFCSPHIGHO2_02_FULL_54_22 TaxID=1798495 RepID=A0A1F6DJU1_9BACT|nr:MAG: hypothetical protein A3C19_00935 [Candidatus Kaiserbacteria bacterium RIFCSPHIGHO2_02_FULL_54_22]OGG82471.1 MAG: hypothetical protein A3I46_00465 [Candidatus Kaiserbacteria bacterium RIFCSPLOWO2_02_FULL_54_13]OGG90422.1 MAG: hypothetical protein A3G12_02230 [Candidatus Kaiserbacteria bacterium RIFCSPLOWO2_12_FULL_54_10]
MVTLAILAVAVAVLLFVAFTAWRKTSSASRPEKPVPQSVPYKKDEQEALTKAPPRSFLEEEAPAYWDPSRDIEPGDAVLIPVKSKRPNGAMRRAIYVRTFARRGQEWVKLRPLSPLARHFSRPLADLARM